MAATRKLDPADGVIVICNLLPTLELGRINRDDLQHIWLQHPVLQRHRLRHEKPLHGFDLCRGCPYADYCTGNCPATALTLTGEVDAPNPESCLRAYLRDGGELVDVSPTHSASDA